MHDVIVVGAGPSGSVLARLLALSGAKVLLLDAAAFPRRKPCGESLNPGAVAALARVLAPLEGAAAPATIRAPSFPHSVINGWKLHGEHTMLAASFPEGRHGMGCRRELLDQWLVEEACSAGASFEQQTRVERLLWDGDRVVGVQVKSREKKLLHLRARYVAGGDGIRSAVAKSAGLSSYGDLRKAAFTARIEGVSELGSTVELFMRHGLVVGLAPIGEDQANITVAMDGSRAASASAGFDKEAFLLHTARQVPELSERLQHAELVGDVLACGPFERRVQMTSSDGMVLIGDAAGYYDPLTGQGIYRAIKSAELAAPALLQALQTGSRQPLQHYAVERAQQFAGGIRLQKVIERASRHRMLWHTALRVVGSSKLLQKKLVHAIGDCS